MVENSGVELGFTRLGARDMRPFLSKWPIGVGPVFANPCGTDRCRNTPASISLSVFLFFLISLQTTIDKNQTLIQIYP